MSSYTDYDSFTVALPAEWTSLPTDADEFERTLRALSARWRAEPGFDRHTERKAELLLRRTRRELDRRGVRLAAIYFDAGIDPGDEPVEENLKALMAVCTFTMYTRNDLDTDLRLTTAVLFSAFSSRPIDAPAHMRVTNVEPPATHHVNAGHAVRLRRLVQPQSPSARDDSFYTETFIVPLGDDGEAAGVLQFTTTNVDLASRFSMLFERIAQTLTLLTPDMPTHASAPPPVTAPVTAAVMEGAHHG
jgi:hypothetical protein